MSTRPPVDRGPAAVELSSHGYVITQCIPGSDIAVEIHFVLTRDEIYVPVAVRRPLGNGPFPAIMAHHTNF